MLHTGGLLRPDHRLSLGGLGGGVQANLHLISEDQHLPGEEGEETWLRAVGPDGEQLLNVTIQLSIQRITRMCRSLQNGTEVHTNRDI